MEYQAYLTEFNKALAQEIKAAKNNTSSKVLLLEGRSLNKKGEWYLYSFNTEQELLLPDDTKVSLEYKHEKYQGFLFSNDGFVVIVGVDTKLSDKDEERIGQVMLYTDPIFLLEQLQVRLAEAAVSKIANTNLALALLEKANILPHSDFAQEQKLTKTYLTKIEQELEFTQPLSYNSEQFQAVATVLGRNVSFIWGPPGTGKTKTLGLTVAALVQAGQSVLVLAHSNAAVDVAMLSVARNLQKSPVYQGGEVLRYGLIRTPELQPFKKLHVQGVAEQQNPELIDKKKTLERQKVKLTNESLTDKLTEIQKEAIKNNIIYLKEQLQEISNQLHEKELELVRKARVVGCTLSKMTIAPEIYQNAERQFDTVIIDEASMAFVPHCVFAATLARRGIAIFGDFRQLAPISQSKEDLALRWLHTDIFEKAGITAKVEAGQPDKRLVMLRTQYRMHPTISAIPNKLFYYNQLQDGENVIEQSRSIVQSIPASGQAVKIYDTSNLGAHCFSQDKSGSRFNLISALLTVSLAHRLEQTGQQYSLGIITPYAAQSRLINKLLRDLALKIKVSTVHRFQGSEQGYIIFDAVEGPPKEKAGQLVIGGKDSTAMRLANVAVSRAQGKFLGIVNQQYIRTMLGPQDAFHKMFEEIALKHFPEKLGWTQSAHWLNLPCVTYYPNGASARHDIQKDLLATKEDVAINWPAGPTIELFFSSDYLTKIGPNINFFFSGSGQEQFRKLNLIGTDYLQPKSVASLGLVGLDRKILWVYLNPGNPLAGVLRLELKETVQLLHNFWSLVSEEDKKRDTFENRIKEGKSLIGRGCSRCNSQMLVSAGDWGAEMKCSSCGYKRKVTADEATDLARLQGIVCGRCGGQVKGRKGEFGVFLGCSSYAKTKCDWKGYLETYI